ncbi:MAG: Asp23/Gls24 family envelope stress response protein [Chloroflexi bacterium]|nr:Asp23/Gls24 family envelope stress response protein [Chloroflexota bacterium]
MTDIRPQDTITIHPSVLLTTAERAATNVKGVSRMGNIPDVVVNLFRGHPQGNGVVLDLDKDKTVRIELYLVMMAGIDMVQTSKLVQQAVTRSIQDLVGMTVRAVNVHIEDVDYVSAEQPG